MHGVYMCLVVLYWARNIWCLLDQVQTVDRLDLSDEEKLCLTLDILQTTQDILEEGNSINDFISYGIDLLSTLLPATASGEEFG